MKVLWSIGLIWVTVTAFAQSQFVGFTGNIYSSRSSAVVYPEILAYQLIADCKNDRQKVTAIFRWITDNIAYKVADNRSRFAIKNKASDPADTAGNWKSLNEMVAANVLRKGVAVCDGYARLFKTLCDYAGIPAEVITGYARTNMGIGRSFQTNHTWNAVYFDSSWHLLDATWASGYVSYRGDEFIRQYDGSYFLAPPKQFLNDHYPEDLQWTLLPDPPVLAEYNRTPFKYSGFVKNGIISFKPAKGMIDAAVGDTITIELETADTQKKLRITDAIIIDSSALSETDSCGEKKPAGVILGSRVRYTYIVPAGGAEWLNVLYNNEPLMRYRLRIRKDKFIVQR